jgi:nucleoside-diphosphate-sugar epimerase
MMAVTDINDYGGDPMRIFVTGASGWIGSAVVPELIESGHEVVGLARSDESAKRVEAAGAIVVRGDLDDPAALAEQAAESDGVIHLAFQHEVAFGGDFASASNADRRAVEAMGAALAESDRPFVLASGMLGLSVGRLATENDGLTIAPQARANPASRRHATSLYALSLAGIGVRSSVLRLPPTVHGDGDNGFIATFVGIARQKGVAGYVGDGLNRWPAVHRSDAARLFRLAAESAPAGSVLHAVQDEGVEFRSIAETMGRHLDVPAESISAEDAIGHFAPLGFFAGIDSPATGAITRALLGWEPTGPTLLEDLEQDHYYRAGSEAAVPA